MHTISTPPSPQFSRSSKSQTNRNGAKAKQHTQEQHTPPPNVNSEQATQVDLARRSGITITPAEIPVSPGTELRNLIVVPKTKETLPKDVKADNRALDRFAAILDGNGTLEANQERRLAEIIQRRTPPTVETPQKEEEEEAGGYAALYSRVKSGLGWASSLVPDRSSLQGLSTALFGVSFLASQWENTSKDPSSTTPKLSDFLGMAAGAVTMFDGAIGVLKEVKNYSEGKKVNPWNAAFSAAQALFGTGMLTGNSAVRAASAFTNTGLHAAKAFQTRSLTDAGAAIASAWSGAVGGDPVALANTVLTYSQLIQGGVSVWNQLKADAAQQAETKVLEKLIAIAEKPVTTDPEADAVITEARTILKGPEVASLPKTSELGKLLHIFRNFSEKATQDLGLLLASLCSLGKPSSSKSSSNLATYFAGSLLGLSLLPRVEAQGGGLSQQLSQFNQTMARFEAVQKQQTAVQTQLTGDVASVKTVQTQQTAVQTQQTADIARFETVQTQQTADVARFEKVQAGLNHAIAANSAKDGDISLGSWLAGAVLVATMSFLIYKQYSTNKTHREELSALRVLIETLQRPKNDDDAQRIIANEIKNLQLGSPENPENKDKIQKATATRDNLENLWNVRNALHTDVRPFVNRDAVAPQAPASLSKLRDDLAQLEDIKAKTSANMTGADLARLDEILQDIGRIFTPESEHGALKAQSALTEQIQQKSVEARARIGRNSTSLLMAPPYTALTGQHPHHRVVPSFRALNGNFGLGVDPNLADTLINLVLNPLDIGSDDAPEALTVAHVTAMATALNANVRVLTAIEGETNAIKDAARRVFEPTTGLLRSLSPTLSVPIQAQIDAFDAAVALTNVQGSQTPANFDTAFTRRNELTDAWTDATNAACQEVLERRRELDPLIRSLTEFRDLGLGLDQTADAALADLHNDELLPELVTAETFGNLEEVDFTNLARAVAAAETAPGAIDTEIGAIVQHVRGLVAAQQVFNGTIPNLGDIAHDALERFNGTRAALNDLEVGGPDSETCWAAMAARSRLREEIIAYVDDSRDAITRILDTTDADRTALAGLLDLAGTVDVPFDGTATQDFLSLLTSENLPAAVETDEALDGVTQAQFGALAAARPVLDTFADTIADETREIQAGLVAKLGEERQRIEALPPRLSALIETERGNFATESAKISDDDATHTLANFTTVFAAVAAVNTAATAARKRAVIKITNAREQQLVSRRKLDFYRTAVQTQLQEQQDINGSLGLGALRNSINPTLFQAFANTSGIALQAGATREQLAAANTAREALREAITAATKETQEIAAKVQLSLNASQSASPSAARTPSQNQELTRAPGHVVINIPTAGAAQQNGGYIAQGGGSDGDD